MTDIEIIKILIIVGCCIFGVIGGGIFATNFYFIKMCINNNTRLTRMETYCKTNHKRRRLDNGFSKK